MLTRRDFAKATAGALVVSLGVRSQAADLPGALDPSRLEAWLEIRADNTIVARTGRGETGTGMSGFYAQVVAEELSVRPETVSLIMGDTDRTPDGGYSSGFLTGAANLRKVAAYAYQKLLDLAAEQLQTQRTELSAANGDARPLGAVLAGVPSGTVQRGGFLDTQWPYDKVKHRLEQVYAMDNIAWNSAYGGLRGLIMRTPGQRQQTFVLESLVNEAAAVAKADPIQFRLDHTSDPRLIGVIQAVAKAANWQSRPSPGKEARRTGSDPITGRGVSVLVRSNAYWVGLAEIAVTPSTGLIRVTKFIVGVECGKIINPRQLDRCIKGGIVMGIGEALKEEVTFDNAKVTSTDWSRYRILTMQETPEIQIVAMSRDDQGFGTGGEAPNALPPPAIAAALFDATGVYPRRIPLTPDYVKGLLAGR